MEFSVVIPCRNAARYVEAALESVAAQSLAAAEVIVVDDGSRDDSLTRIRACQLDAHVICVDSGNAAVARNAGIQAANGKWVAFLDADDIWYPEHLRRMASLLQNSAAVAALNATDFLDAETGLKVNRPDRLRLPIDQPQNDLTADDYLQLSEHHPTFPGMSACVMRRDVLRQVGGFDETMMRRHDFELWLRVIHQRTWAFDPVPSSAYRVGTPGNISGATADTARYVLLGLLRNHDRYRNGELVPMTRGAAVSAMTRTLTDGDSRTIVTTWKLARPWLSPGYRLLFRLARIGQPVFRQLNMRRRRLRRRR